MQEFIGRFVDDRVVQSVMMDEDRAQRLAEENPDVIVFVAPLLHDWVKDENGDTKYFEYGDYHGGPECARCGDVFCQHCFPKKLTEPCPDQTHYLF